MSRLTGLAALMLSVGCAHYPVATRVGPHAFVPTPRRWAPPPTTGDGVVVVVKADGAPVRAAKVRLYGRGMGCVSDSAEFDLAGTATTDAEGRAFLEAVPGGYVLAVHAEGFAPEHTAFDLVGGLPPDTIPVALTHGSQLEGQLLAGPEGGPVAAATLQLRRCREETGFCESDSLPPEEVVTLRSGLDGIFRAPALASGYYSLEVTAPGHAVAYRRNVVVPQIVPLRVTLEQPAKLLGRVIDRRGSALGGAAVTILGPGVRPEEPWQAQEVTTAWDGTFYAEVRPGRAIVVARHEKGGVRESVYLGAAIEARIDFRVDPRAWSFWGRLAPPPAGAPVAGAKVCLTRGQFLFGDEEDSGAPEPLLLPVDSAGRFSVVGLPEESYSVALLLPGYARLPEEAWARPGERVPKHLTFDIPGLGYLSGNVAGLGGTLPRRKVMVCRGGCLGETRPDERGRFRVGPVVASTYAAHVGNCRGEARVTTGEATIPFFECWPAGVVEGRVEPPSGLQFPPQAFVEATSAEQPLPPPDGMVSVDSHVASFHAEVDPEGRYELFLPSGAWSIRLNITERPWQQSDGQTVSIREEETTHLDLKLDAGPEKVHFLGRVVDASGNPLSDAVIGSEGSEVHGRTDSGGRFDIVAGVRETLGFHVEKGHDARGSRGCDPVCPWRSACPRWAPCGEPFETPTAGPSTRPS